MSELASPIASVFEALTRIYPNWYVLAGAPRDPGWLNGEELTRPVHGRLHLLLSEIGERMQTKSRRVVAASFALRYGWAAAAAVGPFLVGDCVPDMSLNNVSLRFSASCLFERVALARPSGTLVQGRLKPHPDLQEVPNREALFQVLRRELLAQGTPVVAALASWSRFTQRALWGQVLSSWGAQFVAVRAQLDQHALALEDVRTFFASDETAFDLAPTFYLMQHVGLSRVYHVRGSCASFHPHGATPGRVFQRHGAR